MASLAEYYRAHREEFILAQELGCTPIDARAKIRDREARLRWLGAEQRRVARTQRSLDPSTSLGTGRARDERIGDERSEPWMMRD